MIDFTVKPDGGDEYKVKAGTRDVLMWERVSKGRSFTHLMSDLRIQDMYRLAHIASKRLGMFTGNLDSFEETCELKFEEVEEADPTHQEASPEQ